MSSKTSSRSTFTMVPSTMSPSLKYLMVSSIAARKASSDPMSSTATWGVEVASVLLVMCGWTQDTDRYRKDGHAVGPSSSIRHPVRSRATYGTSRPWPPAAGSRSGDRTVQPFHLLDGDSRRTHEPTTLRPEYETCASWSIGTRGGQPDKSHGRRKLPEFSSEDQPDRDGRFALPDQEHRGDGHSGSGRERLRFRSPRRFLASRRRCRAARLGLVGLRRRGGGAVASARIWLIRSTASTLLRACERCSCTLTVSTPSTKRPDRRSRARSRRVRPRPRQEVTSIDSDTRVADVLTCCPPGPAEREKRHRRSSAGMVTEPKVTSPTGSLVPTVPHLPVGLHSLDAATRASVRGVVPVLSTADGHRQRHPQIMGRGHLPHHELLKGLALTGSDLHHQFVVHLQQDPGGIPTLAQGGVHPQHRDLDDVGRRPLDRGVERHPFRHLTKMTVVYVQIRKVAASAQDRLGVADLACLLHHCLKIIAHTAELGEVVLHELFGLVRLDPQLLGEPVGAQAVGQPVTHRLDPGTRLTVDLLHPDPEDLGGHLGMEVVSAVERVDERLLLGQVRHDA